MWQVQHTTHAIVGTCVFVWLACAVSPWDFDAWLLEQFATMVALAVLAWCVHNHIQFGLSGKISIAVLFIAHTIGTHYTYSETPYEALADTLIDFSINDVFGWTRNHYDRFVHLLYGVCLALPTADIFRQRLGTSVFTSRFLACHIIISTSAIYELVEWFAAMAFAGGLGMLFLGTQGDIWDAQWDIALAAGGLLAVYALVEARSTPHKVAHYLRRHTG